MNPLFKVEPGQVMESGLFPGLTGGAPVLWADGENVVFRDGGVRKDRGLTSGATLAARPTGIKSVVADNEARAFLLAGAKAYRYRTLDGLTEIASFASAAGVGEFVPYGTYALINNTVNQLKWWPNTGAASDITAPFTRANTIFSYKQQLFAAGTSNGGKMIEWNDIVDPTEWTPDLLNTASYLELRDLDGDIRAARPIAGGIGMYSWQSVGLFTEVGGTTAFGFRKADIRGIGAVSNYSVIEAGGRHFGLMTDKAFATDLVSWTAIDEPAMRAYLESNANWDRPQEVYGWLDSAHNMARWVVPQLGSTTAMFGLGFRLDRGTWTRFNIGAVCGEDQGAFNTMLVGTPTRLLLASRTDRNLNGAELAAFVQTKPLDCGFETKFKRFSYIIFDGTWEGSVEVDVAFTNTVLEAPTFGQTQAIGQTVYIDQESLQSEAVYIHVRMRAEGLASFFKLNGFAIYGDVTGDVD